MQNAPHSFKWDMALILRFNCVKDPNIFRERTSDEARLLRHLLERYTELGPEIRPKYNSSEKVRVFLGLRLLHLDVDEKQQLFKTSAWLRMVSNR